MNKLKAILIASLLCAPVFSQAAEKNNYLGMGIGADLEGVGYAFMFQVQQSDKNAIGFAFHQGEILTFTVKNYSGNYAGSTFYEYGFVIAAAQDAFLPAFAVGMDQPLSDTSMLSLTAGVGIGDIGVAPIIRAAVMFKM